MDKKREKLGMNPSTASRRLMRDLLFKFAIDAGHKCFRCKEELTKDSFTIDHIKPWLNSEDPLKNFFDLENIAFSHLSCNSSATSLNRNRTEEQKKIDHVKSKQKWYNSVPPEVRYKKRRKQYEIHGH